MVAESKKVTSYREERVRSSSVGPREGYGNTLERMNSMNNNKNQGRSPDWNRHLDELLDELQTSINHPSATERSDGVSPATLYGQLTTPTTNGLLMPNGFAGLTDKDKVTSHVKEEYVSPDKKTRTFKESYEFSGQSGGPDAAVTRHGTVSYYTSKFQDANLDGRGRIKRTGSLRDRSPDRFLEASSLLRELRMRDGGMDSLGRQRSRSPESYVQRETPYSTIRSTTGYKSHRTFSESGGDAVTSVPDSIRQKYSPSDPSFTPKTPKRSASLDRRPSFERYGTAVKDSGATSTWRSAREGSWPKYTDTASSRNSNNSTYKSRNQYSYNYMEGDTPERRVRKDRSPSPPAHSRSGSRRRDASPIRPGYGDEQRPNGDFYSANNTYASIDRESRGRSRYREEHRHHVSRDRDGSPGSESRSPSAGHRPYKQRDASPIMPGYGTDADPSKIVRSYNYQYMYDGSGSRSPSPNSVRRYFSQKSIEEQKQRKFYDPLPTEDTSSYRPTKTRHSSWDTYSSTMPARKPNNRRPDWDPDPNSFDALLGAVLFGDDAEEDQNQPSLAKRPWEETLVSPAEPRRPSRVTFAQGPFIDKQYPLPSSPHSEHPSSAAPLRSAQDDRDENADAPTAPTESDVPMWTAEVYAYNFIKTPPPSPDGSKKQDEPPVVERTITIKEHLRRTLRTLERETRSPRSTVDKAISTSDSTSSHTIEPTKHKIQFVRKEPERPPTPVGERVFPKNITSPNAGDQRPPKEVEDLLASLSGQKLHEYRKVDTTSLQQIRSSTPKPEKKVEIDETRIVIRQHSDDEQKKLVPSTAGPAVYYPPGFDQTLQKKEDGKTVPLWMRAEGEMSRGSYKYQSRSKSKEKKGAVAVPVCLPVCCAAPLCCSVM